MLGHRRVSTVDGRCRCRYPHCQYREISTPTQA